MIYKSESGDFNLALTGDTMLSRRLQPYDEPRFLAVRELLRGADAAFTNLEATVRTSDEGIHDASQGTLMTTPPHLLNDLKWMGIKFVSTANNHAADFGHDGILATRRHLEAAELVHSGSGRNLTEARAPGYLDTSGGRVALISTNSFFRPWHRASPQGLDMKGRPGINLLSHQATYTVDEAAFTQLRNMSQQLGFDQEVVRKRNMFFNENEAGDGGNEALINFLGDRFKLGDAFCVETQANKADLADNLKWIGEARRQADWVVVSHHCHAMGSRGALSAEDSTQMEEIADFARDFAHQAIDAGADAVVGHGPHISLGLEVYRDKPIFYSLGNLIFENDTNTSVPMESLLRFDLDPASTPADFFDERSGNETKSFPVFPEYWRAIIPVWPVCRRRAPRHRNLSCRFGIWPQPCATRPAGTGRG